MKQILVYLSVCLILTGCKGKAKPVQDESSSGQAPREKTVSIPAAANPTAGLPQQSPPASQILSPVVATVNGEEITEAQLSQRIEKERTKIHDQIPAAFQEQYKSSLREQVLDELILETLLAQKVRESGIVVSDPELQQAIVRFCRRQNMQPEELPKLLATQGRTPEDFQMELRRETAFEKFIDGELEKRIQISEDELQTHYLNYADKFKRPPQVKFWKIYLRIPPNAEEQQKQDTLAVAEELIKRLQNGADFADIAKTYSDDPAAETGYVDKNVMEPALQKAAFSLEIGKISDVITTQKGCYIIKIMDRTEEKALSFEESKEAIRWDLALQKKKSISNQYLQELKAQAMIQK